MKEKKFYCNSHVPHIIHFMAIYEMEKKIGEENYETIKGKTVKKTIF